MHHSISLQKTLNNGKRETGFFMTYLNRQNQGLKRVVLFIFLRKNEIEGVGREWVLVFGKKNTFTKIWSFALQTI